MLIIIGKTASGKDLVVSRLVSKHGYKKIVAYTTRPMREGETPDNTYHYISEGEFANKIATGFFAEYKKYETTQDTWCYGSAKEDYEKDIDDTVIILTPDGVQDVLNVLEKNPIVIYLYANLSTIKKRLFRRGDDKAEAERRIAQDNINFKKAPGLAHRIVYNNDDKDIDDTVREIKDFIGESI